jgi:uncharacterized damage-inducible protein DinB
MPLTIDIEKLIRWNDKTAQNFHDFVQANPTIFLLPSDIRSSETIAGTLQHIVYLELRFANLIAGFAKTPLEDIPKDSIDALHSTHTHAMAIVRKLLADPTFDWTQELTFEIPNLGRLDASRETFLIHLTMHSIRHYAQLATLVRQAGFELNWRMDYLFTQAHEP